MKMRLFWLISLALATTSGFAASYTITLPAGISLIANHLDSTLPGGNTLDNLLPNVPDGSSLSRWDCTAWSPNVSQYISGFGWFPGGTLNPGEGAMFVNTGAATPITFTGTPHVPVLPVVLPCGCGGWNLLSRQTTNAPTTFQDLTGFAPTEGTRMRLWNGTAYDDYTFSGGAWAPSTPTLRLGEPAFISVPCSNSPPCCPDTGGVKYLQNPDLTNGIDVNATFSPLDPVNGFPWVLADDFPCTNSGPITDIHLWGSWLSDQVDYNAAYTLAIWSDAPTNSANPGYSHPDVLLWTQTYTNGQYTLCPYTNQFENFYDGDSALFGTPSSLGSSSNLYYLCFDARPTNTFYQTGSPTAKTNYWLSVTVQSVAGTNYFGWKSSATAYNDAAVAAFSSFHPQPGDWYPMTDAQGLPLSLAFKITTATNTPPPDTNCCANCTTNNYVSYTNALPAGYSYLANNLCQGTNNTLGEVLPNMPDNTLFFTWNQAAQSYDATQTSVGGSWFDSSGNPSTNTLAPGEGFVLYNPGPASTLIIRGCEPTCPPPCAPTNGLSLVGRLGIGTATWTNLFSCPPPCGARMSIYNNATHDFANYDYVNGRWTPFEPMLAVGQPAFVSVQPNTNCCPLVITNPANLTVPCGTAWNFTTPTAVDPCGCTNIVVLAQPPVTNGLCPEVITETWIASNSCNGLTATATQTVTVVNTNPPTLTCASDKTVECGTPWTFDPPAATNACCGTNLTLTFFDVTNGPCPRSITRTWLAMDCCGNTNTCTQTVTLVTAAQTTVLSANPLGDPNSITVVYSAAMDPASSAISGNYTLNAPGIAIASATLAGDQVTVQLQLGAPLQFGTGYTLTINNVEDASLAFISPNPTVVNFYFGGNPIVESFTGGTRSFTYLLLDEATTVNLGSIQTTLNGTPVPPTISKSGAVTTVSYTAPSCLPSPSTNVVVLRFQDNGGDTQTFTNTFILTASPPVLTCATNKTVECGSPWTFDPPTGSNACNVTISILSTVTNGSGCGYAVTRTWQAADCCTNIATCTQTVTVVSTQPPTLTCAGNKTVECGSPWTFDPPAATNACCGTNITLTFFDVTNGSCPRAITRTWLATDCCGNTNTCTQTVTLVAAAQTDLFPPSGYASAQNVDSVTFTIPGTGTNIAIRNFNLGNLLSPFAPPPLNGTAVYTNSSAVADYFVSDPSYGRLDWFPVQANGPNTASISHTSDAGNTSFFDTEMLQLDLSGASAFGPISLRESPTLASTGKTAIQQTSQGYMISSFFDVFLELSTDGGVTWIPANQALHIQSSQPGSLLMSCAGDKTVPCGSPWAFDPPTATNACCGTNVTISILSTVTNGSGCGYAVTRTWQAADCCTNIATCTQTVTVVNTNPPVLTCASNKTVQCGSAWSFDRPGAFDACCTNVTIQLLSSNATSVSPCQTIWQGVWQAMDCCSNISTCTQTVTVVDTTPPVITCPTNIVIVPLNKNCQLVIPAISVSETDNCTPLCSLVYTQSPPAGTIVSGHFAVVTVTVTDLCGNSSHCAVLVEGEDKTGPVVTCPATMTLTNCLVPCVPVTATDNCCPQSSLKITQSPACGTQIGPGINSVTVTVTDCNGNTTRKVVHLSIGGPESFLGNLFNTGVNNSGGLLPDDTVDSHYTLPLAAVPVSGMPSDYNGNSVAVSDACHATGPGCENFYSPNGSCYIYTPWGNLGSTVSKWIAPDYTNNGCCPSGGYTYTLQFNLPLALNPATATISGRWAADDEAFMYLNGNSTPVTSTFTVTPTSSFSTWTPFTIPAGSGFVPGPNTLSFIVTNFYDLSFTSLRVEFTNAFANCSTCAPPVIQPRVTESLPVGSTATFTVNNPGGTPPFYFQWYKNNVPLSFAPPIYITVAYSASTLQVKPIGFSDAGLYSVVISNGCGVVTNYFQLNVTLPWSWPWGWWNVPVPSKPLAATVGPDLNLVGSSVATNYAITTGTTEDFGLPEEGGQIVNVMHISPQSAASIQVPLIAPPDSNSVNSYTVIMDLYEPGTSFGTPSTLLQSISCCVSNLGSSGQDGLALTLDATNNLHITGSAGGVPFDAVSTAPLPVDAWNRVALVVDNPQDGSAATLSGFVNGQTAVAYPCPCCTIPSSGTRINWNVSSPTVLSVPTNAASLNGEFYVSSIQFHAAALSPQMIAGLGSPDDGQNPANNTAVGPQPVLSATMSNGIISFSWTGSAYVLQETADFSGASFFDVWLASELPFTESLVAGEIVTTVVVNPATEGPAKFYRLIFRP